MPTLSMSDRSKSNPSRTSRTRRRVRRPKGMLPFKLRGGRRPGAGRKPKGDAAGVAHAARAPLAPRFPAHVTVKATSGLPRMRRAREYAALRAAFAAGCDRFGFRLVHYAVLNDHLHMLVEASNRTALTRGLQGLLIRIAKALNKLWQRKGKVFADRYHDRILKTPREVRHCLVYVLANGKKHQRDGRHVRVPAPIDMFTSAPWFNGWKEPIRVNGLEAHVRPTADAHTWLLNTGWRRHGLLSVHTLPATA